MKPVQIKCELINIRKRKDGKIGSSIILKELNNNNCHEIIIDESSSRVRSRLQEQYMGDPRDGVFLSRGMTNININTKGDIWDINQEDWNWYTFSKSDVLNVTSNIPKIEINLNKVKEIADQLIVDYDVNNQELTIRHSDKIEELDKKHQDWINKNRKD